MALVHATLSDVGEVENQPGRMLATISYGSGKTTLLSTLSAVHNGQTVLYDTQTGDCYTVDGRTLLTWYPKPVRVTGTISGTDERGRYIINPDG